MERFIFDTSSHTLVCGILNITPDSFSDGGKWDEPQTALEHALEMQALGADIIDVGAQSTRPGSTRLSADEENARLIPVLDLLKGRITVPIVRTEVGDVGFLQGDTHRVNAAKGGHFLKHLRT